MHRGTMRQPRGSRQGPKRLISATIRRYPLPPWLIILNVFGVSMTVILSLIGAPCDPSQRYWPVRSCLLRRRQRRIAAFSLLKTRPTATGSISASLGAKNVARTPHCLIASRGTSPRRRPTGASIPTKSPARFPNLAATAAMAVATNTSPLPVNAEPACPATYGWHLPHRCPGNDVTLPSEAAMWSRVGCDLVCSLREIS